MADGKSGGGEAHVNPQDAEVVDVCGGLGETPALPPPDGIPPAAGNALGREAGIPDAPDPVAPALMALLQQVLATQQAIVRRLVCVDNNQAQPQHQPQQQQQHRAAQAPVGEPFSGLLTPWAGGALRGQQPPEPQDEHLQAAITAGLKANAKQAADPWRAKKGAKFFIARGGFNMAEEINRILLLLVLDKAAHVSDKITT